MKDSRKEGLVVHLADRESGDLPKHLVCVQSHAIRRQDRDGLSNGIGDCAKIRRFVAELLLGALKIIDVGIDPTPTDKVCLLIAHRRRSDPEPAIRSVEAAKAFFRRAGFLGLPDVLPPSSEFLEIVRMDDRFPLPSNQPIRRKPGVLSKSFIDEIQRAIRQSGPGNGQNRVDESAEFQGSWALSLTHTHGVNPASRQAYTARLPASEIIPSANVEPHAIGYTGRWHSCTV